MTDSRIAFGADCFNQRTEWDDYLAAMQLGEELGYDSLWTPDHFLPTPPSADPEGPIFEALLSLTAVAATTSRASLGLLVSPITFRNPAVLAKMVTTLDHVSGGRAVLGVGAGWAEEEHRQYGVEFGSGFGERLAWLREALPVMRGMLDGTRPSSEGGRYSIADVINSPAPVQPHLPIMIGGGGPRVTLRLVAEYGDMCNLIGPPDLVAEREAALVEHCRAVGRDPDDIERTVAFRQPVIRDDRGTAESVARAIWDHHDAEPMGSLVGPPELLVEQLAPYVELGYRHMIFQFLAPYDRQTMERLLSDVKPRLEALDTQTDI